MGRYFFIILNTINEENVMLMNSLKQTYFASLTGVDLIYLKI